MECAICWDEFGDSAFSLVCGHIFHRHCLEPLFTGGHQNHVSCPICRRVTIGIFDHNSIREIFFTSPRSPVPSSTSDLKEAFDDACENHAILRQAFTQTESDLAHLRREHLQALQLNEAGALRKAALHDKLREISRERDVALDCVEDMRKEKEGWMMYSKIIMYQKERLARELEEVSGGKSKWLSMTLKGLMRAMRLKEGSPAPSNASPGSFSSAMEGTQVKSNLFSRGPHGRRSTHDSSLRPTLLANTAQPSAKAASPLQNVSGVCVVRGANGEWRVLPGAVI